MFSIESLVGNSKDMDTEESGSWQLSFVSSEAKEDGEPITNINALEVICYETLQADIKLISDYHSSLKLVQSVQLNLQNFLEAIVHYSADFLETKTMDEEKFDRISLNFSRLFLNILSMFRSLLDHSDFSLSREFGKNSNQLKAWRLIQSEQYDNHLEYRLFYKLRNYCQHVGMPPMQISFTSSVDQEGIGLRLDLLRDTLLEERSSWNMQLIKDLESLPEKIPVLDAINNWSLCFKRISKALLELKRAEALDAAKKILGHRKRLKLPEEGGQLCAIWLPKVDKKTDNLSFKVANFPESKARKLVAGTPFDEVKENT